MARKKQVKVKTYRRKDGTVVRSSNRSVMTVGDKNVNKRQNTLGGHIRKGATIVGALGGASGVIGGALVGGAVGGPVGAGVGAVSYGTSGAFGGGISGAGYGAGTYYLKKKLAKDKSKQNFDYKREDNNMYEFARRKGSKDKKKRQRNTLKGHMSKGAKAVGTLGAIGGAAQGVAAARMIGMKGRRAALVGLGNAAAGAVGGAVKGAIGGGAVYGAKKAFAKDRSKRNFDYSRIGDINTNMFIGNVEKTSYEFARRKGAKDRKPRSKRSMLGTGAKIAGGLAGAGAIGYAGIKNRKAIGAGLSKAGGFAKSAGSSGMNKARQGAGAVGRGAENLRAKTARAGYSGAERVGGAVAGGKAELNKRVMRKLPKSQRPQ